MSRTDSSSAMLPRQGSSDLLRRFALLTKTYRRCVASDDGAAPNCVCVSGRNGDVGLVVADPMTP